MLCFFSGADESAAAVLLHRAHGAHQGRGGAAAAQSSRTRTASGWLPADHNTCGWAGTGRESSQTRSFCIGFGDSDGQLLDWIPCSPHLFWPCAIPRSSSLLVVYLH